LGWAKDEKTRPEMNAGSAGYEKPSIFAYFEKLAAASDGA
jgi:hypothetical protein